MVSNASQELVMQVVQANIEFNTKVFFFLIILAYLLFSYWLSYRLLPAGADYRDVRLSELLFAGWLRILSMVFLFFYPLYTLVFMFQGIALELIMRYVFVTYGIFGVLLGIFGMIFGFEKFFELLGLDLFKSKTRRKVSRR